MRRPLLLLSLFAPAAIVLVANWDDTTLGLDVTKLRQFPLERVLRSERDGSFDGIRVDVRQDAPWGEVRLSKTFLGRSWSVELFYLREIWKADLDGNGTKDYVFSNPGPWGNGRITPVHSLSILLMEPNGMPVPYFTTMYNRPDSPALQHLVDLDQDGRVELIVSRYDENGSDPNVGGFCSGHWVHHLFRFRNFAAEEYRGTAAAGPRFPIVHSWTYGPEVCGASPGMPVHPAFMDDWGTVPRGRSRALSESEHPGGINLVPPVEGCNTVFPEVAVYDHPRFREIAFPSLTGEKLEDLLKRIRKDRAQVELRGLRNCRVNVLWATQHQN